MLNVVLYVVEELYRACNREREREREREVIASILQLPPRVAKRQVLEIVALALPLLYSFFF